MELGYYLLLILKEYLENLQLMRKLLQNLFVDIKRANSIVVAAENAKIIIGENIEKESLEIIFEEFLIKRL